MVNGNALLKVGSIRLPALNYPALPLGHICVFFLKIFFHSKLLSSFDIH